MIASSGWIDGPYWMEKADSTPDSAPAGGEGGGGGGEMAAVMICWVI